MTSKLSKIDHFYGQNNVFCILDTGLILGFGTRVAGPETAVLPIYPEPLKSESKPAGTWPEIPENDGKWLIFDHKMVENRPFSDIFWQNLDLG